MSWEAAVLLLSISLTVLLAVCLAFGLQAVAILAGRCPRCLQPADHGGWSCPGEFGR